MAVAVKNKSETRTTPMLDRLPVSILMGVAYVLGSLGIVFPLLDVVWWTWLGLDRANPWMVAGRVLTSAAAAGLLVYVGLKLLGKEPARGLCSGIALTVGGVLLAVLLTQWLGMMVEGWVYSAAWLGSNSWLVGVIATAAIGVGLLALLGWSLFKRPVEKVFVGIDDQGWFNLKPYKGNQGAKVRRGTIIALLAIVVTGIISLDGSLASAGNWYLNVPFTGKVLLTDKNVGDYPHLREEVQKHAAAVEEWKSKRAQTLAAIKAILSVPGAKEQLAPEMNELAAADKTGTVRGLLAELPGPVGEADPATQIADFKEKVPDIKIALLMPEPAPVQENRFEVRDLNRDLAANYVKVVDPGGDTSNVPPKIEDLTAGQVVLKTKFEEIKKAREEKIAANPEQTTFIKLPTADEKVVPTQEEIKGTAAGAGNFLRYSSLTLLPHLRFTAPLLLGLLGIWFAWRVVNMPAFGDFLIATEAELNKVSWTTQKRLIQDTVVVLVTVFLLTVFLFLADQLWGNVLSWIGVLKTGTATQEQKEQKW